jgi:membrane protease YdiL (CAAX protease family)
MTAAYQETPVGASSPLQWVRALSLRQRLLILFFVELAYWIATRLTLRYFPWNTLDAEFIRLALRSSTALMCWWLMRDVICSQIPRPGEIAKLPVLFGITLLLAAAFTMQHPTFSPSMAILFGVGSIAVALKEEFLFRGVIQNLLQSRFGFAKAVLITTIVFTAWHYGAVPNTRLQYLQIVMASFAIGAIYVRTGNIWVVVALHAGYDALFAFPTLVSYKYNDAIACLMLLGAVGFACFRVRTAPSNTSHGIAARDSQ